MLNKRTHLRETCLVLLLVLSILLFAAPSGAETSDFRLTAEPWPEADALFRSGKKWLGGDGAYSVDLGNGRILWLFGDSFIAQGPDRRRSAAAFVRNSLAIQHGRDPSRASIRFYWGRQNGAPASFFPDEDGQWHWPGGGILLDGRLLLFLIKLRTAPNSLGFEAVESKAILVENPRAPPDQWRMKPVPVRPNGFKVLVGSAGVLEIGKRLYVFGAEESAGHDAFLVYWPVAQARQGRLTIPYWWTGRAWVGQDRLERKPLPVFTDGQSEFSVHFEPRTGCFLQIQTIGFGSTEIAARWSSKLTGPWSPPQAVFRPPDHGRKNLLIYAGKAHPELAGADLVLTYVVNSLDQEEVLRDNELYYPRFLKASILRR